jgi:transcriptional regulator with XRE-family HTH domain
MNERFLQIMKLKNMSASQFADSLGIQRSAISHFVSGRNKPSLELVMKVLNIYPDVNIEWLLFGRGNPFKNSGVKETMSETVANQELDLFADKTEEIRHENIYEEKMKSPEPQAIREISGPRMTGRKQNKNESEPEKVHPEQIVFFYRDKTFKIYQQQ